MNRKGLTLLEILVASLILTLALAGLLNIFVAGKRWVLHNRLRMTSGELGKYILDPLQMDVRQDQWDSGPSQNCLAAGNCLDDQIVLDKTYNVHYAIQNDQPILNINRVKVVISYPEQ